MKINYKTIALIFFGIFFLAVGFLLLNYKQTNSHLGQSAINTIPHVGAQSASAQEPKLSSLQFEPIQSSSNQAWYTLRLGNITIGIMTIGFPNGISNNTSEYELQIASKLGSSPILKIFHGTNFIQSDENIKNSLSYFVKSKNSLISSFTQSWDTINNETNITKNILLNTIPIYLANYNGKSTVHLLYFKKDGDKKSLIYIPFSNQVTSAEHINASYAKDGFLQQATFVLASSINLQIERIDKEDLLNVEKQIQENIINLDFLLPNQFLSNTIATTQMKLQQCAIDFADMNRQVLHLMPQAPYLFYRKLINMSNFCKTTSYIISTKKDNLEKLNLLSSQMKNILKESSQELPSSIADSQNISIFYNDTLATLWPNLLNTLIDRTYTELQNSFSLEQSRKSLVGLQLNIASMQDHSVVRAHIEQIDSPLKFIVHTAENALMDKDSLTKIPTTTKFNYINGQFFAENPNIDLNEICKSTAGNIGIDLGDAPLILINNAYIQGLWDIETRIITANLFALKASITKNCQSISYRVPVFIENALNKSIDDFKSNFLGTTNELLLSNNVAKKFWVIPGHYRMIVMSYVTGSVMSVQDFSVDKETNTTVTARIN